MVTTSDELADQSHTLSVSISLRRGDYFAGLFVLGYGSGFASRIVESVHGSGLAYALLRTFDVSVIVWISCIVGILLVIEERTFGVRSLDLAVGIGFVALAILPIPSLNWLAISGLGVYILLTTTVGNSRRGATVLLASTIPLLWSPILFHFFSRPILSIDASLVSWLLGTPRTGTLVEFADHSGELAIFPPCSSIANVSLAFLCWVMLSQSVNHKRSAYDLCWGLLACGSVIALNVARLGIYGLSKWHYATFHSPWADAIDNTLITAVVFGISALGVRRELFNYI